jgi:hypothetical protein
MHLHLKAECGLYTAALLLKGARLAHQFNLRAVELLQRSTHLREEFKLHVEAEHGGGGELKVIGLSYIKDARSFGTCCSV